MVRWDQENKVKMLLIIIEHLNPASLPWDQVASAMGPDFTSEAVRGQYKSLKKGIKPSTSKSKPTTPAKASKPTTTTPQSRKRKAQKISLDAAADDDSEDNAFKSSKIKRENPTTSQHIVEVFKAEPINSEDEDGEGVVDLERDALYDAA